ncbi:MAG TPA: GNAT family N-acetyltransferase [Streptosporangiaceae bacterium]
MPAARTDIASPGDPAAVLLREISRRWQAADPLLPEPATPAPGAECGAVFTLTGTDGQPEAVGACDHWHGDPDSLELTWGAARRFQLAVRVGGPDVAAALDGLLGLWRVHLAGLAETDDPDSAAVLSWPSRDVDGITTLLRRGFAPRSVVAARGAGRRPDRLAPSGVHIRQAGPADVEAVLRLGLQVIRYDAHFGGVVERPSTAAALGAEAAAMLAEPEPWTWLAEQDGTPVGVLIGEGPKAAQWIAPMVGRSPVAYNMLTFVCPAERGAGVARALVGRFHDAADSAGVPVTLLHYEQTNPLAAPFWGRQGYRPLWTSWEARPACTLRS